MKPQDQIDFIKEIAGIDTSKVEEEYRELFAERTILNRDLKQARAVFESKKEVEKVDRVDVSDLQKQLSEAMMHNQKVDKEMNEINAKKSKISTLESSIENGEVQIKELEKRIAEIKEKNKQHKAEISSIKKEIKASKPPEYININGLNKQIAEASDINKLAEEYEEFVSAEKAVIDAEVAVSEIGEKMKKKLEERESIISGGRLPFKNIGLDKDLGLTISGIPFSEMSTAQKIRVMSRIYIESNPLLKVIYIQDGSLLDDETMRMITEMSDMKDFQFLVEVVGEQEGDIVMREGRVVTDEEDKEVESKEEL
jgi:DNA repair exonuclease SbcCD ATPase subunit